MYVSETSMNLLEDRALKGYNCLQKLSGKRQGKVINCFSMTKNMTIIKNLMMIYHINNIVNKEIIFMAKTF